MKRITLVYETQGETESISLEGQGCGYKLDGKVVSVWNNTPEGNYTKIVPLQRVIFLEQTNT